MYNARIQGDNNYYAAREGKTNPSSLAVDKIQENALLKTMKNTDNIKRVYGLQVERIFEEFDEKEVAKINEEKAKSMEIGWCLQ